MVRALESSVAMTAVPLLFLLLGVGQAFLGVEDGVDVQEMGQAQVDELLQFVLAEIHKLKVDHRELDECHGLEMASLLRGKMQVEKSTRYSLVLKVQPTMLVTDECVHQNVTAGILHPEICEAEVLEDNDNGHRQRSLVRSACLQVEELQE